MEDLASPSVLPGPSHVPCWQPTERQIRKTGTHDIFQGVNLRQLRRLFQAAGEQDAEQRARMVWRGGRRTHTGDPEEDDVRAEVEIGLAQALVGLRVRARTKSGIRAEGHRDGHRRPRPSTQHRSGDVSARQPVDVLDADTEAGLGGELEPASSAEGPAIALRDTEMDEISNRTGAREKDPQRHLHRIRH
ncbi:uncharacterized protein avpi1 [Sardina pilchardus]|uniref:uncharacterized protein avpi1 n=1 Tax=Sardina pilchardus TaxID=27697 RepID=UPI002E0FF705